MRRKKNICMICLMLLVTMFFTACNIFNKSSDSDKGKNTDTTTNGETSNKDNPPSTPTPSSGTSVKQDILNYVNKELTKVASLEEDVVYAYSSVSGANYTSDEEMYGVINETVIPEYKDFVSKLKSIKPKTKDVQQIHQIYVNAAEIQYSAFVQIAKALDEQDANLIEEANQKLAKAREGMNNFQDKLNALAEKNGVTINGK